MTGACRVPVRDVLEDPILRARYTVYERIGRGGSGSVFRARQMATGQTVALKVFDDTGRSPHGWARFVREARLCATLHHPHIVRIIDAHESEAGVWSVFEWVPGRDLAAVLAGEGCLEPDEAIRLMAQVLDALAAAHQRGIVHRDIKPANIMISATGARRNAWVLDFGVGTLLDEQATEAELGLTRPGDFVGTPAYAAPEQLRGEPPTPRTDLYAWALTFVECLTGRRVIEGRSVSRVIAQHLRAEPISLPPLLERHALGHIIRRALTKDVRARDVTVASLIGVLQRLEWTDVQALSGGVLSGGAPSDALSWGDASSGGLSSGERSSSPPTVVDDEALSDTFEARIEQWAGAETLGAALTPEDRAFLVRLPMFRQLSPAEFEALARIMRRCTVPADTVLAELGDDGVDAFVIGRGTLALELPAPDGASRVVARLGSGTVVGEACLVEPAPRTLRMRAETEIMIHVIDGERFATLCDGDDTGAHKILRAITITLCDRLRQTNARLEEQLQGGSVLSVEEAVYGGFDEAPDSPWDRLKRLFGRSI